MRARLLLLFLFIGLPLMGTTLAKKQPVVSVVGTNDVPAGTICSAASGAYTDSPTAEWGQVLASTTAKTYICVHNIGPGPYSVVITDTLPTPVGTVTTPQSGKIITDGGYALIEFDLTVLAGAKLGQVSFTIMFRS